MDENDAITYAITHMTKNYENALERAGRGRPIDDELFNIWNFTNMPLSDGARFAVVKKGIELFGNLSKSDALGENAKKDAADLANDLKETLGSLERSKAVEKQLAIAKDQGKNFLRDRCPAIAQIDLLIHEDNGAHATEGFLKKVFPLLKEENTVVRQNAADLVGVAICLKPELFPFFMNLHEQNPLHADTFARIYQMVPHDVRGKYELENGLGDAGDLKARTAQAVRTIKNQAGGKAFVSTNRLGDRVIIPIPPKPDAGKCPQKGKIR